jgi:ElaB/YqjD/DUF883 family membrane-anchored ribosome-binding protein
MEHKVSDTNHSGLTEIIAEEKLNQALRNIDRNLSELTEKLRKPKQQVQYVADNWRQWRKTALIGVAAVAGIIIAKKLVHKFHS